MSFAVKARELGVTYGEGRSRRIVFEDLDFSLMYGEFVAVVGRSGSGKSSLLRVLAGIQKPSSGQIEVFDSTDGSRTNSWGNAGFVYQDYRLVPFLSVEENVALAVELAGRSKTSGTDQLQDDLLAQLGIQALRSQYPRQLSGGEQQRVALARALATEPDVVFADEPTGALDAANARDLASLLSQAASDRGVAVVVATHDPNVQGCADQVIELDSPQDLLAARSSQ